MFKKIKQYLKLQANIQFEIIETLASICKYLDYDGFLKRNPHSQHMKGHFFRLKELSAELRESEVLK